MNIDRDNRFVLHRTLDPLCLMITDITPRNLLGFDNIVKTRGINVIAFVQWVDSCEIDQNFLWFL